MSNFNPQIPDDDRSSAELPQYLPSDTLEPTALKEKNGLALAALIVVIVGVLITLPAVTAVIGLPIALIGGILAIVALVRGKKYAQPRKGMAAAALSLAVLAWVVAIGLLVYAFSVLPDDFLARYAACGQSSDQATQQQCVNELFAELQEGK